MKISVVMATYNGANYIQEQLDTIRLQSREADELIICDDGSTDGTVDCVKRYITQYELHHKWKVVINEHNLGYANNFNKVTLLAQGDIIFFADQDDLWDADKIKIMAEIMESHEDCMVLCTDYEPYYDGKDATSAPKKVLEKMPNNGVLEKITLSKKSVYIGALGCCMCVRKDFYHEIKEYWFDGWAQDDRMWRLAQCANGCYIVHSNLIKHRIHGNNTATYGKYHTIEKRVRLFEAMLKADMVMERMLQEQKSDNLNLRLIRKHIEMMEYRIELLSKRHFLNCVRLLRYIRYYQEAKSYLVEIYLVLNRK